ncbi:10883_t:CDS:2 [Gigaspora margarita]|uniref:10883_t:CDS:1 n=1 Tax=Gigaspora margarita TaxID=4874 RepID=A0ABM8W789_GIGMA|nr:10883_t:CDS:2 [Gigaspora margarita]
MEFNQSNIVKQLLEDINFQPFEFYLDQLQIVVFGIEKKHFLYVQSFISSKCNITIYEENKIKMIVNRTTPTDVWSKIDYKSKFDANDLFGTTIHMYKD